MNLTFAGQPGQRGRIGMRFPRLRDFSLGFRTPRRRRPLPKLVLDSSMIRFPPAGTRQETDQSP